MKFFKLLLYKILGLKNYLKLVSKTYITYIDSGFGKEKYSELHYLKTLIKPGFTCLDIGANLGYYSYFLAQFSGKDGRVFAVEPVPVFSEIWKANLRKYKSANLVLFPYALGDSEKLVEMGMPAVEGVVHHGMTRVVKEGETGFEKKFSVEMKNPDLLFAEIDQIDFIKVDVEGYESEVFDNMQQVVKKNMPIIQTELSGDGNRKKCIELLSSYGYQAFVLKNNDMILADENLIDSNDGDFYFFTDKNQI
ncbi:MAG: hypothetical protein C0596_08100 [Marinilabiliales bacterium]|nr:MAG: hypothetical protein C0596_08100 [Marinilabiliales bacterium]